MSRKNKIKIFKTILLVIVVAIIISAIIYFFMKLIGLLLLLGIQIAQIFLIIIPGEPIEILAGMCYR